MKKLYMFLVSILIIIIFIGCSSQSETKEVTVSDIMLNIKEQIALDLKEGGVPEDELKDENLPTMLEGDLKAKKTDPLIDSDGLDIEYIEEGIILQAVININSDRIIILKAKDKNNVQDLKKSLEDIRKNQAKIWEHYLPDQYKKIENTIIKEKGNYLLYVTYDNPDKIETIFDEMLK